MEFSIGELSRRTNVKIPTIRYYEQVGLLAPAPRTEGQQRRYLDADANRLNFIRHARELGFEIDAVRELLDIGARPNPSCDGIERASRRYLDEVDDRIARLTALRDELSRMISECGNGRVAECRIVQVMNERDR